MNKQQFTELARELDELNENLQKEIDRLRAENATLRGLVREAYDYEKDDLGWLELDWEERVEKALGRQP